MKYFKITRTWSIKAEDEAEAVRLVAQEPDKYLESEAVTRTEYKKRPRPDSNGWGTALRDQLLGSAKR